MQRIHLEEAELCVRMLEAATGTKRPLGRSLIDCLQTVDSELLEQIRAQARAAMLYFAECYDGKTVEPLPSYTTH